MTVLPFQRQDHAGRDHRLSSDWRARIESAKKADGMMADGNAMNHYLALQDLDHWLEKYRHTHGDEWLAQALRVRARQIEQS